jgi:hypothetical protein
MMTRVMTREQQEILMIEKEEEYPLQLICNSEILRKEHRALSTTESIQHKE